MNPKVKSLEETSRIIQKLKKENKKIVFAHGIFDILHKGHVYFLSETKKLGDVLIVGVDHDDNAKILKGPKRPINDHESRMFVVANLEPVDFVFLIPSFKKSKDIDQFFVNIYQKIKPNIVASSLKAGKYGNAKRNKANQVDAKFVDISGEIYTKNTSAVIKLLKL